MPSTYFLLGGGSTVVNRHLFFNCGFDKEKQEIFFHIIGPNNLQIAELLKFSLPFVGTPKTTTHDFRLFARDDAGSLGSFKEGYMTSISIMNGRLTDEEMVYMSNISQGISYGRYYPFYILNQNN